MCRPRPVGPRRSNIADLPDDTRELLGLIEQIKGRVVIFASGKVTLWIGFAIRTRCSWSMSSRAAWLCRFPRSA